MNCLHFVSLPIESNPETMRRHAVLVVEVQGATAVRIVLVTDREHAILWVISHQEARCILVANFQAHACVRKEVFVNTEAHVERAIMVASEEKLVA